MTPGIKKVLSPFVGAVVLLFGLFGGVLRRIAPPDTTGLAIAVGVVPFLLLVVFLLLSALSRETSGTNARRIWLLSGIALAILSVPAIFLYPKTLDQYTYVPQGDAQARKIHASDEYLTLAARNYLQSNPEDATPARLARNFESDELIWEKRGMEIAQQRLLGAYAWLVVSLCAAIFCFAQVIASGPGKPSKGSSKQIKKTLAGAH
jgi:hypothetical protein